MKCHFERPNRTNGDNPVKVKYPAVRYRTTFGKPTIRDMDPTDDAVEIPPLLKISDKITFLPVVHGSGQFAAKAREFVLAGGFDCLAVPLPRSFRDDVEAGVLELPHPSVVVQRHGPVFHTVEDTPWLPEEDSDDDDDDPDFVEDTPVSYVPIEPSQAVVAAIRVAMGEHIDRHYVDLETEPFTPFATVTPDPYAVRRVAVDRFAAAVLPNVPRPRDPRTLDRFIHTAIRLRDLERRYDNILIVDNVAHWPWIREQYDQLVTRAVDACEVPGLADEPERPEADDVEPTRRYRVDPRTLLFLTGELPFLAALYEQAREELEDDDEIPVSGIKELLLAARDSYREEFGDRGRRVTPLALSKCVRYIRNLALIHRRLTPDLVTIITASQQVLGDAFALHVAENANRYRYAEDVAEDGLDDAIDVPSRDTVSMGIDQIKFPEDSFETGGGDVVSAVSRLPGPPVTWTTMQLHRRIDDDQRQRWRMSFNPLGQCSYPPEDERIERFRGSVFDRAKSVLGNDLAKTEKFTTSVRDGIDIRETLRHWHDGSIYVKVIPPSRAALDACVMIFDSPADPRRYTWRTTWFAEHSDESTLAFFATDYRAEMIGPGIGAATYGGALFLYPPVAIHDVWSDRRLDFVETLEERLIAAACRHSRGRQVALLSHAPAGGAWRRMARRFKKQLVHVPLSGFSDEEVQNLRRVHVLGGKEVRSYAADFIRRV